MKMNQIDQKTSPTLLENSDENLIGFNLRPIGLGLFFNFTNMKNKTYHFMFSLALAIMGMTAYMSFTSESQAMTFLERKHCDYIFSSYASTQIDRKDYPRCEKRFIYLTKIYFK